MVFEYGEDTTWILGDAKGADTLALRACKALKRKHIVECADWERYGKVAGPIRNGAMLDHEPDLVIWFSDNLEASKGTKNCVKQAEERDIPVRSYKEVLAGT